MACVSHRVARLQTWWHFIHPPSLGQKWQIIALGMAAYSSSRGDLQNCIVGILLAPQSRAQRRGAFRDLPLSTDIYRSIEAFKTIPYEHASLMPLLNDDDDLS